MALPLLNRFIPKTVAVIRLSNWKLDGQKIMIIKRGASAASKNPDVTKGGGRRINGSNTVTEKNTTGNTFADQKKANINSAEGEVFDATLKKTTETANN